MEYFDTGNDPRLKFAEKYTEEVLKIVKSSKIPGVKRDELNNLMENIHRLVKQIRWSYLPKKDLVENEAFQELQKKIEKLSGLLKGAEKEFEQKQEMLSKVLNFMIENLRNLGRRLIEYPDEQVSAVDYYYVKVISKEKHPKADKLYVTYVTNGEKNFRVVTNDATIKPKEIVPLAHLPPKDFMGIISEGMFIGGNGIRAEKDESLIGKRPELTDKEKKNVLKEIFRYIE
ncbi:MAG: hypothetical protein ACP6IP_04830 [Candidatus Njordarchaeia archaeon]